VLLARRDGDLDIRDTVNEALRAAIDVLAAVDSDDRSSAWR